MSESVPAPRPLKVLIVEDNRDARTTLRMLLSMAYGYDVYEAEDGASAIDLALELRPHAALIDIGLPGMNGFEVARRLRSELARDQIFLVALTGYGADEDRMRTEQAGFDLHLVKPVDTTKLAEILGALPAADAAG